MRLYAALYQLAIYLYFASLRLAAVFNDKAALFINGRKDIFARMRAQITGDKPSIWMHCASLGEFEQGRPLLDALRTTYPGHVLIVTFFSPSGYEVRKGYSGADHVFYLPADSPANAAMLLDIFRPSLCIFVKYELWYFYLSAIAKRKIPLILVSAVFNKDQGFFKWYGGLQRSMLHCFSRIFVQDHDSAQLLATAGITNVTASGDTRFDRVIKAAGQAAPLPIADAFTHGHKIIVAGSTWKEDELLLCKAIDMMPSSYKMILVPHEVHKEHINSLAKLFGARAVLWSQAGERLSFNDYRVLIVDKVGLLMQLYRYGTLAWIGGGFGKEGVHNVLEAAVYGTPCFYGPVFHQFIEAKELIDKGGAFIINDASDLAGAVAEMSDTDRYQQHASLARKYVLSRGGATEKIMEYVKSGILPLL